MFSSGIRAESFIENLQSEIDVALNIPKESYVNWLNSLEQLLYSEVIREQGVVKICPESEVVEMSELSVSEQEECPAFEDICAVYSGNIQLIKSTLASGVIFKDCYYKSRNGIGFNIPLGSDVKIIYYLRPKRKYIDENGEVTGEVMLPVEFIELAAAKLRGEALKLANEDAVAGKWLAYYNSQLENFKEWILKNSPAFGI